MTISRYITHFHFTLAFLLIFLTGLWAPLTGLALPPETYTTESVLSSPSAPVVRVGVEKSGIYILTESKLRSWGFNDFSRVRVFGYGGKPVPNRLSAENYIDDLPMQYSEYISGKGVVFYAQGPGSWQTLNGVYSWLPSFYSTEGYYFVTQVSDGAAPEAPLLGSPDLRGEAATSFMDRLQHELEAVSPGDSGGHLVGESFISQRSQSFSFNITDPADDRQAILQCSFASKILTSGSLLNFSVNGTALDNVLQDKINVCQSGQHYHAIETLTNHSFTSGSEGKLTVGIQLQASSVPLFASLNYLAINYKRKLRMPSSGNLLFWLDSSSARLAQAGSDVRVWDVTDPVSISVVNTGGDGNDLTWTNAHQGQRAYAAWRPGAVLPEPASARNVGTQNLHAHQESYPRMVIVSPAAFRSAAQRIAQFHRQEGLSVEIIDPQSIYNEFSSGTPDPGGLRKYFKMLYDRSLEAHPESPLQYVLIMGRPSFDPRHLTEAMSSQTVPTIPSWMPTLFSSSLTDVDGYTTDDVTAMLEDNSGERRGSDKLSVAIGRLPVTSSAQAESIVDKLLQYATSARSGLWKNRFLFTADDEDSGEHLLQTERMISGILATEGNSHFIQKLYLDAYDREGEHYPAARTDMFADLEEGVVWWNFIGHANTTSWTANGLLSYTDLNNMYLRHWPFLYTATCDFLRWDSPSTSGGEVVFMERYGGCIGAIAAVRPVYVSENGLLSAAMGRHMAQRDENGRFLTPGEVYRRAKNDIRTNGGSPADSPNRLRYVFMGDPALRLTLPDFCVRLESLPVSDSGDDNVLAASGVYEIPGSIVHPLTGEIVSDFDGTLHAELYDAEHSVTTHGWGNGTVQNYEDHGSRLYVGGAEVKNGRFTLRVAIPEVVAQNYRPAAFNLYATEGKGTSAREAAAVDCNFYVYGEASDVTPDTSAPVIESLVLNQESFKSGDTVNPSPLVMARVTDNVSINLAETGIGHNLAIILDGTRLLGDVANYYTPFADGNIGGDVAYPLSSLSEGAHSLRFRVWDTAGNVAEQEIEFFVKEDLVPEIFEVYSDANPATTQANFYIVHNRPESMVDVTVTVYNLLGQPVWSGSASGPSDMFESVPVTWNLTNSAGRRVPRGIYVYRASVSAGGSRFESASRRIAVTGGN